MIQGCFRKGQSTKVGSVIPRVCFGIFLVVIFLVCIHPWLSILAFPVLGEHTGAEYYTSGKYLKYDNGTVFQQYVTSFGFAPDAEVVDFYHVDHWTRDNLFTGKFPDYFSVDLQFSTEEYSQIKSQITTGGHYHHNCFIGDFELWLQEDIPSVYIICFCDDLQLIRCIFAADRDRALNVGAGLERDTRLQWNIDE